MSIVTKARLAIVGQDAGYAKFVEMGSASPAWIWKGETGKEVLKIVDSSLDHRLLTWGP